MILSVDPGMTTGLVVAENIRSPDQFDFYALELNWSQRFWFLTFFKDYHPIIEKIIIEEYRLFKHKASDQTNSIIPSVRVIGIIEAYAFEYSLINKIVYQIPAEIKSYGKYTLNILDHHLEFVGPSKHTRDAYRHLRLFLRKQNK